VPSPDPLLIVIHLAAAGLLDAVIHVAPVLVGDDVRLFDHAGGTAVNLDPMSSQVGA
jgi:hypothetical protein